MSKIDDKTTDEKFKEIQRKLKRRNKLMIEGVEESLFEKDTLEDLIERIFLLNASRRTIYKTRGTVQCLPKRNRSLGDIFNIVRTYRPNVTVKEVSNALCNLIEKNKASTLYCSGVKKRVYFKAGCGSVSLMSDGYCGDPFHEDEYGRQLRTSSSLGNDWNYYCIVGQQNSCLI